MSSGLAGWNVGQWYHIAIVRNGNNFYMYRNGQQVAATTYSGSIPDFSAPFYVGYDAYPYGYNINFNGEIDEFRISKGIARSIAEIEQAYEIVNQTHAITIDFAASLDSENLITNESDTSFTINSQTYGATNKGDDLYAGDKIIIKENIDGTEYLAQGTVTNVNSTTGAVTVHAWDSGATFPTGGYTVDATVFKWQREYWDITGIPTDQRDAIKQVSFRMTDGSQGRNIYIDDIESVGSYLTNPTASNNILSGDNRYFQYRAILSTTDINVTPSFSEVAINIPQPPTNVTATDGSFSDKVTVSWTKSEGANHYRVYRDGVQIGPDLGDVDTFDDTGAGAPSIQAGTATAAFGQGFITLSLPDASIQGTTHTYTVVAFNLIGASDESLNDTGYRGGSGTLSYQWQRSAADSDADYADIDGATTNPYDDTDVPLDGSGRYYRCVVSSVGLDQQISPAVRGALGGNSPVYIRSGTDIRSNVEIK
jgi:hypothetical protein